MDEREAEYIASAVLARVRPAADGWFDVYAPPRGVLDDDRSAAGEGAKDSKAIRAARSLFFPIIVMLVLAWLGARALLHHGEDAGPPVHEPALQTPRPPTQASQNLPPSAQQFSDPRTYASAMTTWSLASGNTIVLRRPNCRAGATWWTWSCTTTGRSIDGPYANDTLTYRCHTAQPEQPDSRPTTSTVDCGPVSPPPVTP
jgi:hypothetical protein